MNPDSRTKDGMTMRKAAVLFGAMLIVCRAAWPAALAVGDTTIPYRVPAGFVSADADATFGEMRRFVETMLPPGMGLLAMHVDASGIDRFRRDGVMERYVVVTANLATASRRIDAKSFKELGDAVRKQFRPEYLKLMMDVSNRLLEEAADGFPTLGRFRFLDIASEGWYAESETAISHAGLVTTEITLGGDANTVLYASVSTVAVSGGRLLVIEQHRAVRSPYDIDAFKEEAQDLLREMEIPGTYQVTWAWLLGLKGKTARKLVLPGVIAFCLLGAAGVGAYLALSRRPRRKRRRNGRTTRL